MKKNYPASVLNYLQTKAADNWQLECQESTGIEMVVVVPCICEFENIKLLLDSLARNSKSSLQKTLVIFVINNSVSSSSEVKADNKSCIDYLRKIIYKNFSDDISKYFSESGIRIGLIDAATSGKEFNNKIASVGLARKIGMDSSLQIFDYSKPGKKIIICLDADCVVDENYLQEIQNTFNEQECFCALVDFEHTLPEEETKKVGILSYEIFLRHYVTGLLFADSSFAFHTIGSTIICEYNAYTKIGGMNSKKAAEDFYFLQKLAKNYEIHQIWKTKVKPSSRDSWRVPFGTGKSMTDFSSGKKEILVFDPEIYLILKKWLLLFNSDLILNPDNILKQSKIIHPELYSFLDSRRFTEEWNKILQNSKSEKQLHYQRKNWFDAFKTLKLIHHLRDTSFPMMDVIDGVKKLFNVVEYSSKFGSEIDSKSKVEKLKYLLSELKVLEFKFHNN